MINSRMEKLLENLKKQRINLECRKKRFELWQEEIAEKDETGTATIKELQKQMWYWVKECRLADRIETNKMKLLRLANIKFEPQITVYNRTINSVYGRTINA